MRAAITKTPLTHLCGTPWNTNAVPTSRAKRPGRVVGDDEIGKVCRSITRQTFVDDNGDLEEYSVLDRKPVEGVQDGMRIWIVPVGDTRRNSSSRVLQMLQLGQVSMGDAV